MIAATLGAAPPLWSCHRPRFGGVGKNMTYSGNAVICTTDDCPLEELRSVFPDNVWALQHPPTQKWGCYKYEGVHGLAVFTEERNAVEFATYVPDFALATVELSFDEARRVAQGRPLPIVALLLCDNLEHPEIHYVR